MRTRIKVCGVTTPDDAAMAARAGADFVGVILTESPRRVTPERAKEIAVALPATTLLVAVFADEPPDVVERAIEGLPVHAVQVRGWLGAPADSGDAHESTTYEVWHVLRDEQLPDPPTLPMIPLHTYVVDSYDPKRPGGTARRSDWEWARQGVNSGLRLFVAGGLTPENVSGLVENVRPFGVDASSGLEREPGKKDPAKVLAFVSTIRTIDRNRPKRS